MEGKFLAIVSQEDWHRAQEIKAGRMMESFSPQTGKRVRHCVQENKDLWCSKLRCSCGCGFRKNVWHRYENRPTSYGYKCYNILNNGSAKQRRDAGADDTGYCDQPMIADWKLELMGKVILEQVFREQRDLIHYTISLIRQSYRTARPAETSMANLAARMERLKAKKETLLDMRTEGEITKEEFLSQRQKLDTELQKLTAEQERLTQTNTIDLEQPEWGRIQDTLEEILDLSQPKPSPDLIRRFVTQVVPTGKTSFCWYLNLDGRGTTSLDMTVEGRKNHAVLTFGGEHYAPQEEISVIDLNNACLCPTPHRLLSRAGSPIGTIQSTTAPRFVRTGGLLYLTDV